MSTESLKAFLAELESDEALREELKAAGDEHGVPADAVAAAAAARGYEFTVDDISSELEEAELEGVAGGYDLVAGKIETAYKMGQADYKMGQTSYKMGELKDLGGIYFKFF